jgi:hypothetical protein
MNMVLNSIRVLRREKYHRGETGVVGVDVASMMPKVPHASERDNLRRG